jgi:hypothetical protein
MSSISLFFSRLFGWFKKENEQVEMPVVGDVAERIKQATESILENESLTADLDDAAAKELLAWGLACAQKVAQDTAGLEAFTAESSLADRLQATRRLMRAVSNWGVGRQDMDAASASDALSKVMEQATVIYGQGVTPPPQAQYTAFLAGQAEQSSDPSQMIKNLRQLIEASGQEETDG